MRFLSHEIMLVVTPIALIPVNSINELHPHVQHYLRCAAQTILVHGVRTSTFTPERAKKAVSECVMAYALQQLIEAHEHIVLNLLDEIEEPVEVGQLSLF